MFNFEDGELETKNINSVEIFAVGTHNGKEFDESDLKQIVESYRSVKNEIEAPIKAGHSNQLAINDGMPALGWVNKVYKEGKKVKADFKNVPKKVAELIKNRAFKKVSIELLPTFTDSEGNEHKNVLSGVALLGADTPAVKTLDDIPKLFDQTENEEVLTYSMEIEEYAEHSVHEPEFDGTSEKDGQWGPLDLEDFPEGIEMSEIDDHFIVSKSGFPPENFGDLALEVVDENGNLDPDGLESAHQTVGRVDGLSEQDANRARNIIEQLAEENFDSDTINFLEGDDDEEMSDKNLNKILEENDISEDEFSGLITKLSDDGGNNVDEKEVEKLKQERDEFKERVEELEDEKEELTEKYSDLQEKVLEYKLDSACQELGLAEEKEDKFRDFVTAQVEEFSDERAEEVIDDAKDLIGTVSEQPDTQEYTAQTGTPESGEENVEDQVESILEA